MNRIMVLGVAIFFAVVGIALLGGEKQAEAGRLLGCHGCSGCAGDCGGMTCCGEEASCCGRRTRCCGRRTRCSGCMGSRCSGRTRCCGRSRLFGRCNGCSGCSGCDGCSGCHGCDGCSGCSGCDGAHEEGGEVAPPPAPEAEKNASFERAPMTFRRVAFRR